jgi:predicted amidophosphoribosyltransferase
VAPQSPHTSPNGPHLPRRLRREQHTVEVMIRLYCRRKHSGITASPASRGLCPDCSALLEYSYCRIEQCRFGTEKPTCARCTVHCFRPERREQIRAVMRYAGPRMTVRHPYLALRHLLDRH